MGQTLVEIKSFFWGLLYGGAGWHFIGRFGMISLVLHFQRARELRLKKVLTSPVPLIKYVVFGVFCIGVGIYAGTFVWTGNWGGGDIGIIVGTFLFACQSFVSTWAVLSRGWDIHEYIDFLDANQRWVDSDRIEIFPNREVAGKIDGDLPV